MDPTRELPQVSQENPRAPSSSDLDYEQEFLSIFDWHLYQENTIPLGVPSHIHNPPLDLNGLITKIPLIIDSVETNRRFNMMDSLSSDDPSDYSSHPSPPDLVREEGSTSPSDQSDHPLPKQLEDLQQRSDVSLGDFRAQDDKWTYPQADQAKSNRRIYSHNLQVVGDASMPRPDQGASLKRRLVEQLPERRARQLVDPDQTADVRKSGACLPCRVSKTRCHDNGVCPTCRKAFPDHSHLVCTRTSLAEAWPIIKRTPDFWSSNPDKEEKLYSSPCLFTGKPREISIFFSNDPSSPSLRASVQAYRWDEKDDGKLEKAAFVRDHVPSHEVLQKWVENQTHYEKGTEFEQEVSRFLLAYSQDGYGLPRHSLVTKVHKMACFFRIWKTSSFWCRDPSGKVVNLPMSVQAELRSIALNGIHFLENGIFKELDDCITPSRSPKPDDKMALWASMWQLILVYRDVMIELMSPRGLARTSPSNSAVVPQARFKLPLENFFPIIAIFYHYHFRMKKSVEVSMDWLKAPSYPLAAVNSQQLRQSAKTLIECRKSFMGRIQKSENEIDQLLCNLVVNHEMNKLNARSRVPKATKANKKSESGDCDMED